MDKQEIQQMIQQEIETYMRNKQFNYSKVQAHEHNGVDTNYITAVNLQTGTPVKLGMGAIVSTSNSAEYLPGTVNEQIQTSIVSGKDMTGATLASSGDNLQLNLLHQPQNASNQSFINAIRPPIYASIPPSTISATLGGNTVTISDYLFQTDELANALMNVFDSSGTFLETQVISSNTSSVITIASTWLHNVVGGTYEIFQPVFLGSADFPWQRFYTCEGTGAGIRFGVGPTANGQNGLLYMNAAGDLYWRNKSGASTKLN
jgi:hypothetical protein